MRLHPRVLNLFAVLLLGIATVGCLGSEKGLPPETEEAIAQYDDAIEALESGDYESAKLDLEELVDDTSDLSLALDNQPETKAQARWAYVLANSFFQVNRWVETLGTILTVAGPLLGDSGSGKREDRREMLLTAFDEVYAMQNGVAPAGGTGLVAPILDGFLTEFISFFNSNLNQIDRLRQDENAQSFSLTFRALPVRIGGFDIMDLAGEHDMGEVFFFDSLYRLINGLLTTIIAVDLTVNIPESDLVNHTLDVIGSVSEDQDPVGSIVSLIAAYIHDQERLLGLASADDMKAAGDFYEDGFLSILQAIEFMGNELETDEDQDDDLIGYLPPNDDNPIRLELHMDFQPTPVPGVDTSKLENLQIELEEDILTSIDNISRAFGGESGVRISWARDIVPILSLAVVTLLQSGAFDGLIDAALESAELDAETISSVNQLLNSDLLQANVVEGLILGFIPDVFEFDVGAYFEDNPQPPRNFLPFWTPPTTAAVFANGTSGEVEEVITDWASPTLLMAFECDDALDDVPFNAPLNAEAPGDGAQTFILCNGDFGHKIYDCDAFAPEGVCINSANDEVSTPTGKALDGMLDETRSPTFASLHENFLANLREMGSDNPQVPNSEDWGIRRDGIYSPLPYTAFRDPSFGQSLWIRLDEGNNEELDEYITPQNGGFRIASNRSLNALIHTLFDEILEFL